MEVEAKFTISDESTFQQLLHATSLGRFRLGEATIVELHDTYLDTGTGAVRAAGYACRLRRSAGGYLATLKGLGGAEAGVHRRVEYEVDLPGPLPPLQWPPSAARDLILRLCGEEPLFALFEIRQTRHSRVLRSQQGPVADLSLDRVSVSRENYATTDYLELEVELLPGGTDRELGEVTAELQGGWGLVPAMKSKYERAQAWFRRKAIANGGV